MLFMVVYGSVLVLSWCFVEKLVGGWCAGGVQVVGHFVQFVGVVGQNLLYGKSVRTGY